MSPDQVTALFTVTCALVLSRNVWQLHQDKLVRGIHWWAPALFTAFAFWNVIFYASLDQWWAFAAGILNFLANVAWLAQIIYYTLTEESK